MSRIAGITCVAVISALIAWVAEPHVRGNTEFFVAIITIFSVFGGFLVAVLSIAGEPLVGKPGGWAILELNRDKAINRMNRAQLLFYLYLLSAVLILVVLALQKTRDPILMRAFQWIDLTGLWLAIMGVIFSFALPTMLIGIQKSRIDGEIEHRRDNAS
jgi:hypothetical protein